MKIVIFPKRKLFRGTQWFFHVAADNGEIIAQSEGYQNRGDCVTTAQSLRKNLFNAEIRYG